MRYICHDCGNEIPEDMNFCPHCGCLRSKSTPVDDKGMPADVCPQCGTSRSPGDLYCKSCGAKLPDNVQQVMMPRMRKYGPIALALAVIPGFFNIFGIGHLIMRQWSRGLMFLAMSAVIWYMCGWTFLSPNFMVSLVVIAVYFFQLMDIFRVVYSPEDT